MAQGKDPRSRKLLADSGSEQGTAVKDWKDLRPMWVAFTEGPEVSEPRVFSDPRRGLIDPYSGRRSKASLKNDRGHGCDLDPVPSRCFDEETATEPGLCLGGRNRSSDRIRKPTAKPQTWDRSSSEA